MKWMLRMKTWVCRMIIMFAMLFGVAGTAESTLGQCVNESPANVLRVDKDSQAQSPDGRSWTCAFPTIQQALAVAKASGGVFTQVWVKAETYMLDDEEETFELVDGVWLLGGFAGTESSRTDADPYANPTILDGNDMAYHVVTAINTANSTVYTRIDGFIIQGGNANGKDDNARGGGLAVMEDTFSTNYWLKVSRCRFQENSAASRGGAVAVFRRVISATKYNVELTNCEFTENTSINGGAVWIYGSEVIINNSLFANNTATNNGGAIALAQICPNDPTNCDIRSCIARPYSVAALNSCTLTKNHAGGEAGGIHVRILMELTITGSILWENTDDSSATDTVEKEQIVREYDCEVALNNTATYSCIEGLDLYAATGNIGATSADDPEFVSSTDFRLLAGSPCIEMGHIGVGFPDDDLDFDNDGSTTGTGGELAPDIAVNNRVFGSEVDIGAYEVTFINSSCQSDCVDSSFNPPPDGEVDGADLAILLADWGPCAPPCCSDSVGSDFLPPPDGEVDGADLAV